MIRRSDRIERLKNKMDVLRMYEGRTFQDQQIYTEALDNIECELNEQHNKLAKRRGVI